MLSEDTKYPLVDGQEIYSNKHGKDVVVAEIEIAHDEPICWTDLGQWYNRSDGTEMVSINKELMTAEEFYRRRSTGEL